MNHETPRIPLWTAVHRADGRFEIQESGNPDAWISTDSPVRLSV